MYICVKCEYELRHSIHLRAQAADMGTTWTLDNAAPEPNYYLKRDERMFIGFIFM